MWELWLILSITLALLGILYKKLILVYIASSSLITMLLSIILHNITLQVLIFTLLAISISLIMNHSFFFRPSSKKTFFLHTNQFIGQTAVVVKAIGETPLENGLVKLDGETWPAVSVYGEFIPKGASVKIHSIKGIRLFVSVDSPKNKNAS